MKILHLVYSFAEGGRRRAVATLLERLPGLGMPCDLGCVKELGCSPEEITGLVDSEGSLVMRSRSAGDRRALRRLRAFCEERGVDVIHAHDAASQYAAARAGIGSKRRPKLLMTFHRSLDFESARLRDRVRNTFANARSQAIVTGSSERRKHYLSRNLVGPRKVVRIPFGIDLGRFRPDEGSGSDLRGELGFGPEVTVLGVVGHFGPEKGVDVAVRAFGLLAGRPLPGPVALVIVGDGTPGQREALHAMVGPNMPGPVRFVGFQRDVDRWFRAFDLFIHAPRLEAFGLVLAEAMATGLPVAATRVGGIPDIVRQGRTGLLVEPDSPAELADALHKLLGEPSRRRSFGEAARETALAEYGADLYAARHAELYSDLIAGRAPRGADQPTRPTLAAAPAPGLP